MSCKVELSNYYGQYLAGSTVTGKVICNFSSSENIQGAGVKLKGVEKVRWKRGKNAYIRQIKFLEERVPLLSEGRIGPGRFEFPFSFTLPLGIPTSYAGEYGWVTYTVKAKVETELCSFNYKNKVKIRVIRPVDLNRVQDSMLFRPGTFEIEKSVSCCFFGGGTIALEVNLEKKGFVTGEKIKITARVLNNSNVDIGSVEVDLIMAVKCTIKHYMGDSTIEEKTTIANTKENGFNAGHREKYYEFLLPIPRFDAVPNFFNCKYLTFRTKLKVFCVLPGFHQNLILNIPVALADIPLGGQEDYSRNLFQNAVPNQQNFYQSSSIIKTMGLYD